MQPLDERSVVAVIEAIKASGVEACAICFLFSFLDPSHERRVGTLLANRLPDLFVSLSSDVQPEFREYERLSTTVLNAYLQPIVTRYLDALEQALEAEVPNASVGISMSRGGLMSLKRARRFPIRTALSGPAAGVVGAIHVARMANRPDCITLDMGGTSTDVCLIRDYVASITTSRAVADFPVRQPAIEVDTIGAGGGSVVWFERDGIMKVGPISAGASPGPACYGQGGAKPTVSDANLILGRLSTQGLIGGRMALDIEAARRALDPIASTLGYSHERTAHGAISIVVSNMVRSLRTVSVERGYDPRKFTLFAFGGAGPLHATEVARAIGISEILVPPHPGILCAQGLIVSELREDFVRSERVLLNEANVAAITAHIDDLLKQAIAWYGDEKIDPSQGEIEVSLDMRYLGQNFEIPVQIPATASGAALPPVAELRKAFFQIHEMRYGYFNNDDAIEVVNIRMTATARLKFVDAPPPAHRNGPLRSIDARPVYFSADAPSEADVYDRSMLSPGDAINGPAVVEQFDATTLIYPDCRAVVDQAANIVIEVD